MNAVACPSPAPSGSATEPPRLLDQVRQALQSRHYNPRTEEIFVEWIRRFVLFHDKRHPAQMAEPEVARFLSYLAVQDHVSPSTQVQARAALVFLYRHVLARPLGRLDEVVRAERLASPRPRPPRGARRTVRRFWRPSRSPGADRSCFWLLHVSTFSLSPRRIGYEHFRNWQRAKTSAA